MSQILLNDLLNISEKEIDRYKIRFNQSDGETDPMELYQKDPELINTNWFLWKKKQDYFKKGQIGICLLKLAKDTYLLTTIKEIIEDYDISEGLAHDAKELDEYKKYYGRVIVKYRKTMQTQGVYYKTSCDDLIVNQILPDTFSGYDFPGYDNVRLPYAQLEAIIALHKKDWIAALKNQKAVYLITDTFNGKLYVGSATSDKGMLLQRWQNYVNDGHGGNKELKELVDREGFDYVKEHFQYSILENFNSKVDDHIILERESWWKETLKSRTFGYNAN